MTTKERDITCTTDLPEGWNAGVPAMAGKYRVRDARFPGPCTWSSVWNGKFWTGVNREGNEVAAGEFLWQEIKHPLLDAQARHREYPESFGVPSDQALATLRVGQFVKVGFLAPEGNTERMWLLVVAPGVGVLDNDPVLVTYIKCGERVPFETKNVMSILGG